MRRFGKFPASRVDSISGSVHIGLTPAPAIPDVLPHHGVSVPAVPVASPAGGSQDVFTRVPRDCRDAAIITAVSKVLRSWQQTQYADKRDSPAVSARGRPCEPGLVCEATVTVILPRIIHIFVVTWRKDSGDLDRQN